MFKKSTTNKQLRLFTIASTLMCKRESKQYEDEKAWHMQFYRNVTCNIDEDVFRPLFDEKMGCPTKAIRQLVAMSILKEGAGCSDETLYENCRFNLLWRAALGLFNIDDQCPAISSYYHLRELICNYEETSENHENLYEQEAKQRRSKHLPILLPHPKQQDTIKRINQAYAPGNSPLRMDQHAPTFPL